MRKKDLEALNALLKETEERLSQRILDSETRLRSEFETQLRTLGGAGQLVVLDYPVETTPRYGYGRPPHRLLHDILDRRRADYEKTLQSFLELRQDLLTIPTEAGDGRAEVSWINRWIPGLDAVALYGFVRQERPRRYVEIGSGISTTFVRRAIDDADLATTTVSIDPRPRAEIDAICDEVVRSRLENADLSLFERVEPGDIVFFDGSHRAFTNSDVVVFFLEVLPALAPGVLVQIHDITLPYDYPPDWSQRFYSEQYVLAASLLAEGSQFEVVLPNAFVTADPDLRRILEPLWSDPAMRGVPTHGESFWLRTT